MDTYLKSLASLFLLLASSIIPNLIFFPKFFQNWSYLFISYSFFFSSVSFSSSSSSSSSYSSASALIISRAFLTSFLLITFIIFICYNCSLETFKGKSSESTTPLIKLRYLGISSSNSSVINTLLTYSFKAELLP